MTDAARELATTMAIHGCSALQIKHQCGISFADAQRIISQVENAGLRPAA